MTMPFTRREFVRTTSAALGAALAVSNVDRDFTDPEKENLVFVHPGLLHGQSDLERMRSAVANRENPIFHGYQVFRDHRYSQLSYTLRGPFEEIGRNPNVHQAEFDADANAAYQLALMACITGERGYADKAENIVRAWASTLRRVTGADAVLSASLGGFKLVNAAELLRYTAPGWTTNDTAICERVFNDVFYPVLKDFALFANGNWDTAAVKMLMAIGVFCDDRQMVDHSLRYYVDGAGNGRLTHYIYDNGQCQESGRDQAHTQLGLAHLADTCEAAWHQGLDLYSVADKRVLTGFEYTAKHNLGGEVPFVPDVDQTGKYRHKVISPRGPFRPVYEQIYNHYATRVGLLAPYTKQVVEQIRPEGAAPGADHPGFGTLLFAHSATSWRDLQQPLPRPAGLVARESANSITLLWIPVVGTANYVVSRSEDRTSNYSVVAQHVRGTEFVDRSIIKGKLYSYVVAAANVERQSEPSSLIRICAGLPTPWSGRDIGETNVGGWSQFDGSAFIIESAGTSIGGKADECYFVFAPLGEGSMEVRFVPQVASQFAQFGLMMRASAAASSIQVMLVVSPDRSGDVERPRWRMRLAARPIEGEMATDLAQWNLSSAFVDYGRLIRPFSLRLTRSGSTFVGAISADGLHWINVGTVSLSIPNSVIAGLAVCSGIPERTTRVCFDQVKIAASSE